MTSREGRALRIDAILMAGDKGAYKHVYGKNKALLEIKGVPVIAYVVSALERCRYVSRIFIVGPREEILEALERCGCLSQGDKEIIVMDQWNTMLENAWNTFHATVPTVTPEGTPLSDEEREAQYKDKVVLVLGADIPLVTPNELNEFIENCDVSRYDYFMGMTGEENLRPYYPAKGSPGIHFAYFCFRDSKERQNNLHLIRVFRVLNREIIQKMYRFRYQKKWKNILRLFWTLIRTTEIKPRMIFKFLLLHLSRMFEQRLPWFPLLGLFRRFLRKEAIEHDVSMLLKARFVSVRTSYGGAALDVDNEAHFEIICKNFDRWNDLQAELARRKGAWGEGRDLSAVGNVQGGTRIA